MRASGFSLWGGIYFGDTCSLHCMRLSLWLALRVQAFEIFQRLPPHAEKWYGFLLNKSIDDSAFGSESPYVVPFGSCKAIQQSKPPNPKILHLLARLNRSRSRGKNIIWPQEKDCTNCYFARYMQWIREITTITFGLSKGWRQYSSARRFSEERQMYRLLLRIPEARVCCRPDSNIKTLTRYYYIAEAGLQCTLAFLSVNHFGCGSLDLGFMDSAA